MNSSCLRGGVNYLRVSIWGAINIQFFHTLNMQKTISRSLFLLEEENKRRSWNVGPIERRKESRSWVFNCLNIIIWISRHVPPIKPFLSKNPERRTFKQSSTTTIKMLFLRNCALPAVVWFCLAVNIFLCKWFWTFPNFTPPLFRSTTALLSVSTISCWKQYSVGLHCLQIQSLQHVIVNKREDTLRMNAA